MELEYLFKKIVEIFVRVDRIRALWVATVKQYKHKTRACL